MAPQGDLFYGLARPLEQTYGLNAAKTPLGAERGRHKATMHKGEATAMAVQLMEANDRTMSFPPRVLSRLSGVSLPSDVAATKR